MIFKDVSVSTISDALSALEALCDYALYKSTFTLHYITLHYIQDLTYTNTNVITTESNGFFHLPCAAFPSNFVKIG